MNAEDPALEVSHTDPLKPGWKAVVKAYGGIFFATLMTLWITEWALWSLALWVGVPMDAWLASWGVDTAGNGQLLGIALVALGITQITKAPRIAFTAAITPAIARPVRRWRAARVPPD